MVAVLVSQRERLRARVRELEEGSANVKTRIAQLEAELVAVKADNVALVERLRFVRDYQGGGGGETGRAGRVKGAVSDVELGGVPGSSGAVERKYQADYENSINPFNDFKERQKEMRVKQLKVSERAVLQTGNFLLGSKHARMFVFYYMIVLHGIIVMQLVRHWAGFAAALHTTDFASTESHQAELIRLQTKGAVTGAGMGTGTGTGAVVGAGTRALLSVVEDAFWGAAGSAGARS